MLNKFSRTEMIFGSDGMEKLRDAKIAVFGLGGVGGYTVEALARCGVGTLDLFDNDKIDITNINRQIHATTKTIGEYKVDIAKERVLDINPNAVVNAYKLFFLQKTSCEVDFSKYDYIVDAIDTVSGKIELVLNAKEYNIPIISSMGAGNKIDPTMFKVADIYETKICPLAKVMRRELKKRGIEKLKVVYSRETPVRLQTPVNFVDTPFQKGAKRQIPGSNSFVPSVAGLIIAGEVVKDLTGYEK